MKFNHPHGVLALVVQAVFFALFCVFVRYHPDANARHHPLVNGTEHEEHLDHDYKSEDSANHNKMYPMFQDVHVMIFIGFGFLMMFLKRYGLSAVGLNFMVAALCLQWAILVNGFFHLHDGLILVDLNTLLGADFTSAAVLISFGALIGKTTPTQLILLTLLEVPIFAVNEVIGRRYFGAVDIGDSMFVHAFGAYFGLAASLIMYRRDASTEKEGSSHQSDMFAMIGTVFLWVYWPSFNGGAASGDAQLRCIINTYISLIACCFTTFAISSVINREKKFDMVHIQNSTLAGGVAIGTAADLMIHPWGAVLVGILAATLSVCGYVYITPMMASRLRIHDTCGVHNLHGMPGVFAGIVGAILAAVASEATYGVSLYVVFPERAPPEGSAALADLQKVLPDLAGGSGISGTSQALYQLLALVVSIAFAVAGGIVAGFILRLFGNLKTEELYEDEKWWVMEEEEGEEEHRPATA